MFVSQKDALHFYTQSQSPVINAFLRCDQDALEEAFRSAFQIHCAVIRRALDETPAVCFGVSEEEGRILLATYRRRTPETLTRETKKEMLFQDIEDIHHLLEIMKPAEEELRLFRCKPRVPEGEEIDCADLPAARPACGEVPEGMCIIQVPAGIPVLRHEEGFILPPLRCRAENGGLLALAALPVDPLIVRALAAFGL